LPDDYEDWEGSEDLEELVDILATYNVGPGDDLFDTRDDLRDELIDMGGPEEWDRTDIVFRGDGTCYLAIGDEEFEVGGQEEFEVIYEYLDDMDIDFDVQYEGD